MARWSLMGEYLSLLILGIIFVRYYCYEGRVVFSLKKKIFLGCLLSATASILLNILTVVTISNPGCIPLWLGMLLNSGYFVVVGGACSLFALFMFLLTLENGPHGAVGSVLPVFTGLGSEPVQRMFVLLRRRGAVPAGSAEPPCVPAAHHAAGIPALLLHPQPQQCR